MRAPWRVLGQVHEPSLCVPEQAQCVVQIQVPSQAPCWVTGHPAAHRLPETQPHPLPWWCQLAAG